MLAYHLIRDAPLPFVYFRARGKFMAYIYKIVNRVNGKLYIGKTQFSIERRFQEHIRASKKENCANRPLYKAMKKYGIDNFYVELIEETNNPEEREQFWIKYYNSYVGFSNCQGYNATLGGDGKAYIDREPIIELFQQGLTQREISSLLGYDAHTIRVALNEAGISHQEIENNAISKQKKGVQMLDKITSEQIALFSSIMEAERYLQKPQSCRHIAEVCNGKRKSAYGYKWRWNN